METLTQKEQETKKVLDLIEQLEVSKQITNDLHHRATKAEREVEYLRGVIRELESKVYGGNTQ